MKPFNHYFSLQKFQKLYESKPINFDDLFLALDNFFGDNNLLKPFTNHDTHRTNFGYYWEKYLNKNIEDYEKKHLFDNIIAKTIFYGKINLQNSDDIEKSYMKLINKVNSGNFNAFDLSDEFYDFESGKNFNIEIQNWEPTLFESKIVNNEIVLEIAKPEPIQKLLNLSIEFKTSELIIADWFKIKEFTQLVDKNINKFDINSSKGRMELSQYYLDNFNFIYTTSWNDSTVFKHKDTFIFARDTDFFEFPKEYKNKGKVDKELRALCIIEKQHLINLLDNPKLVDDYLAEYDSSIVKLKIKPGIYNFTISSDPNLLKENFEELDLFNNFEENEKIIEFIKDPYFQPTLFLQKAQPKLQNFFKMRKF